MGNPIKIALLAAALVAGPVVVSHSAKADHVTVSLGNIAFGYSDGYWDRDHHWHKWHNRHEAETWRAANADHYYDRPHSHEQGGGWRDEHWW
jgi:hypothetical protein